MIQDRSWLRAAVISTAAVVIALAWTSAASAALPAPRCSLGPATPAAGTPLYTSQQTPWNNFVPSEAVPDQWLAKLYTETLGCAPDQASYASYDSFIRENTCGLSTLAAAATAVLTSREFLRERRYDYAERLLVLWRVGRESEPDPREYARLLAALQSGRVSWDAVVRSFLGATGFAPLIPRLCSGQLYGWNPGAPVIEIPVRHNRDGSATGPGRSCRRC